MKSPLPVAELMMRLMSVGTYPADHGHTPRGGHVGVIDCLDELPHSALGVRLDDLPLAGDRG